MLMKYPYDVEYDPYVEETNKEKYNKTSYLFLQFTFEVRTWDEIVDFFF